MSEWRYVPTTEWTDGGKRRPMHGIVPSGDGPVFYSIDKGCAKRIIAYLNNLEQYKALADHVAEPLRAFVPVTASQPDIDAFRYPWLEDYDALKAQEGRG